MGHYDCSRREAAQAKYNAACEAYNLALTKYNDAVQLQKDLEKEKNTALEIANNYSSVGDYLEMLGGTFANKSNIKDLQTGYDCIASYVDSVVKTKSQCDREVTRCYNDKEAKAKARLDALNVLSHTHCVWVSDISDSSDS